MNLRFVREDVGHVAFAITVLALAAISVMLAGCPGSMQPITASELANATKVNGAAASCFAGSGLYGHGNAVVVNAEHATPSSGKITIASDCAVTIEANQPATAAK